MNIKEEISKISQAINRDEIADGIIKAIKSKITEKIDSVIREDILDAQITDYLWDIVIDALQYQIEERVVTIALDLDGDNLVIKGWFFGHLFKDEKLKDRNCILVNFWDELQELVFETETDELLKIKKRFNDIINEQINKNGKQG